MGNLAILGLHTWVHSLVLFLIQQYIIKLLQGIFFITFLHSAVQKPCICSGVVKTWSSKPSLAFKRGIIQGNGWEHALGISFSRCNSLASFVCVPKFCRLPVLNITMVYSCPPPETWLETSSAKQEPINFLPLQPCPKWCASLKQRKSGCSQTLCKGIPRSLERYFPLLTSSASRNAWASLAPRAYRNCSACSYKFNWDTQAPEIES